MLVTRSRILAEYYLRRFLSLWAQAVPCLRQEILRRGLGEIPYFTPRMPTAGEGLTHTLLVAQKGVPVVVF